MSEEWKKEWIDENTKEKIYWCYLRDATPEEIIETKKEWEEYNATQNNDDNKILWEDWGEHEERDVLHYLEKAKTDEEFKESVLVMELDGLNEGVMCFSNNPFDIPTFEEADYNLSDYTKLRILNLVSLGYIEGDVVNWIFRNELMNRLTDSGNITDEQFRELNSL